MNKILVVGSGGREHSLVWKLSQSPHVSEIYSNISADENKLVRIDIDGTKKENFQKLYDFVQSICVNKVIVGPEVPLCYGIVDYFYTKGYHNIYGPTKRASRLESDKFFSFDLMSKLNIPQADSIACHNLKEAKLAIEHLTDEKGVVVKARGLTAGKGVSVCDSADKAIIEAQKLTEKYGNDLLIAKRLFGEEFSVFGFSDGNKVIPFEISIQDHKRLLDRDKGPNTGGMGSYCPAPIASSEVVRYVADKFMTPVVQEMREIGSVYKGFIYAGMMLTSESLKIIEFNARLGDPETQSLMMLLGSDLHEHISDSLEGKLESGDIKIKSGAACSVVLASRGYVSDDILYEKSQGLPISGLNRVALIPNVKVFHAGTKREEERFVINGGRVLNVTAYSQDGIENAQKLAYTAAKMIKVPGNFHHRRDIADKAILKN